MHEERTWLRAALAASGWERSIHEVDVERIGVGYGLSGEIYRLRVMTDDGENTIVAKIEQLDRYRRAVAALCVVGDCMGRSVPALIGLLEMEGNGILLLEDISPATQGDDLISATRSQTEGIVGLIATLHGCDFDLDSATQLETWEPRLPEPQHWRLVLQRAHTRYPEVIDFAALDRLADFPAEVESAGLRLVKGRPCVIHLDPHLDNILWRQDGSPVLLDWSNARIGPSGVDVAALLIGYVFRDDPPMEPHELIACYADARRLDRREVELSALDGLKPFVLGIVSWAGEISNEGFDRRKETLRDSTVTRAIRALAILEK